MSKTSQEHFIQIVKTQDEANKQLNRKFYEHATVARNVFYKKNVKIPQALAWINKSRIHSVSFDGTLIQFQAEGQSYFVNSSLFFSDMGTIAKHYRKQADNIRALQEYEYSSNKELRELEREHNEKKRLLETKIDLHTTALKNIATGHADTVRQRLNRDQQFRGTSQYQYNW